MSRFEFPYGDDPYQLVLPIAQNHSFSTYTEGLFVYGEPGNISAMIDFLLQNRKRGADSGVFKGAIAQPKLIPIILKEEGMSADRYFALYKDFYAAIVTGGVEPTQESQNTTHFDILFGGIALENPNFVACRLDRGSLTPEMSENLVCVSGYYGSVAVKGSELVVKVLEDTPYFE